MKVLGMTTSGSQENVFTVAVMLTLMQDARLCSVAFQ